MRIVWKDGEPETLMEILLPPFAHARIRDWSVAGRPIDVIVEELNQLGILTSQGNLWCKDTVRQHIRSLEKREDSQE